MAPAYWKKILGKEHRSLRRRAPTPRSRHLLRRRLRACARKLAAQPAIDQPVWARFEQQQLQLAIAETLNTTVVLWDEVNLSPTFAQELNDLQTILEIEAAARALANETKH